MRSTRIQPEAGDDATARSDEMAMAAVLRELAGRLEAGQSVGADELAPASEALKVLTACITDDDGQGQAISCRRVLAEVAAFFIGMPALLYVLVLVLGSALAGIEGWPAFTGINYILSTVCGLANPLGSSANVSPQNNLGKLLASLIAIWSLGLAGLIAGMASNSAVVDLLTSVVHLLRSDAKERRRQGRHKHRKGRPMWIVALDTMAVTVVVVPAALYALVVVLGAVFARAEEWRFRDGFYYLLADLSGLPNPLVNPVPTTAFGEAWATWSAAKMASSTTTKMSSSTTGAVQKHAMGGRERRLVRQSTRERLKADARQTAAGEQGAGQQEPTTGARSS